MLAAIMKPTNSSVAVGLLIFAVLTDGILPCPTSCLCTTNSNGTDVDCSSKQLKSIPRNFPNDTMNITMSFNPIFLVRKGSFQNMTVLSRLRMMLCDIRLIMPGAFINLPLLRRIVFSLNRMTRVLRGVFIELPALESLYVYNFTTLLYSKA
ncbi:unnamed protein product [Mytilus coruscus]|nr:unnamed protein product [Mytilus coruscus]